MKVFLSLCLLFSLVSPALLLSCTACENEEGTECTKNRTTNCMHFEYLCTSAVVNGNLLSTVPRGYYSCWYCEAGHYAFNTGSSGFFSMAVDCCGSDNCNAQPVKIPSEPMEPNGQECSGCYAEDQGECSGNEVVKCLGDQTRCIKMQLYFVDVISGIDIYIISARGCTTPEMCEEDRVKKYLKSRYMPIINTLECGDAV